MTPLQQTDQLHRQRAPDNLDAWILGSSIASLASAVHLIKDAKVTASRIHILEPRGMPGDGLISIGDSQNGYDYRAGCMPSFHDACMEELFSKVPSATRSGRTVLEDMKEFNSSEACNSIAGTHILIQGNHGLERLKTRQLTMGLKDRVKLVVFMLKSEESLSRKRVSEVFSKSFFESRFWAVWSTIFGFQPWHSAVEFQRCLRRYSDDFYDLNNARTLDRSQYNQQESIIKPIVLFLQNCGVDFQIRTKITDIVTHPNGNSKSVAAIKMVQDNAEKKVTVGANDIVIMSLGSIMSGSTSGTNKSPPCLEPLETENILDESWSLWLDLGTKNPKLGDPYNFCTRQSETRLESFTVTLKDPDFFNRFVELTHDRPGLGALVSLINSNWLLSMCIPCQPFYSCQPDNVQVFWGYGLRPEREGNFVKKPMLSCSGEEIMIELLTHLNFPSDPTLQKSINIPCVMPRMTATLLPRTYNDRPTVIPENMTNLAVIGQFVEVPDESTVSMDYSVRGAQQAVMQLMGLHKELKKTRKSSIITFYVIGVGRNVSSFAEKTGDRKDKQSSRENLFVKFSFCVAMLFVNILFIFW